MTADYLVAHRKSYATAAVFAAAFVKSVLDIRQLAGRNSPAVVADTDDDVILFKRKRYVNLSTVAAVL